VAEELAGCLRELRGETSHDRVTAVHEARKHLKKARSALRLVREAIGDRAYRREGARLRDAAGTLSEIRDAQVALATFDKLVARFADALSAEPFPRTRQWLARRQAEATDVVERGGGHLGEVTAELEQALADVDALQVGAKGWNAVAGGLRRGYLEGRARFGEAEAQPTLERLHEWRKRAKDTWYHLRILHLTWPAVLGDVAEETHALSEHLGDDHDLGVLRETLLAHHDEAGGAADVATLLDLVDQRRAELQTAAHRLGRRLYAEKPKRFLGRMEAYWRAWRAEAGEGTLGPVHSVEPVQPVQRPSVRVQARGDGHTPAVADEDRAPATAPAVIPEPTITPPALGSVERPRSLRPGGSRLRSRSFLPRRWARSSKPRSSRVPEPPYVSRSPSYRTRAPSSRHACRATQEARRRATGNRRRPTRRTHGSRSRRRPKARRSAASGATSSLPRKTSPRRRLPRRRRIPRRRPPAQRS
jgi:CHAD domain-containing protein